jgi:hypothetical protein
MAEEFDPFEALRVFAKVGQLVTTRPQIRPWSRHEAGVLRDALDAVRRGALSPDLAHAAHVVLLSGYEGGRELGEELWALDPSPGKTFATELVATILSEQAAGLVEVLDFEAAGAGTKPGAP